MTNYQMAWWPANYTAKAQADSGALGKVYRLRGVVGHNGPAGPGWDSARNKHFQKWLTDPVQNGAGALMDFGCYNALWSLWYLGKPESVYAQVTHVRPELFPKVEDNATLVLRYKDTVGLFEGSWSLPRGFQDLEVFGVDGSTYMTSRGVELRQKGKEAQNLPLEPLPKERAEPVAYMVWAMAENKPIEGLTALDINVDVVEIIEAAKRSAETGRVVSLPLFKSTPKK
jgi:predicted dehydrogenase